MCGVGWGGSEWQMHSLFSLAKSWATKEDGAEEVCGLSVNENTLWSLQESWHVISTIFFFVEESLSKVL